MIDKILTTLTAKLRVKRFLWPKANGPNFIEKITQKQRQTSSHPATSLLNSLEATTEVVEGYECITITPNNPLKDRRILYIHGGAFVFPITKLHWKAIADIVHKSNVSAVVPLYPFVPEHTYKEIHAHNESPRPYGRGIIGFRITEGYSALRRLCLDFQCIVE